jgi:hypothetical protein
MGFAGPRWISGGDNRPDTARIQQALPLGQGQIELAATQAHAEHQRSPLDMVNASVNAQRHACRRGGFAVMEGIALDGYGQSGTGLQEMLIPPLYEPSAYPHAQQLGSAAFRAPDVEDSESIARPSVGRAGRLDGHCHDETSDLLPPEEPRPILTRLPADIASAQPSSVASVALKSSPAGVAVVTCLVSCPAPPCAGPIQIHPDPKPGAGHDPVSWPLLACADHDLRVVTRPALTSPA